MSGTNKRYVYEPWCYLGQNGFMVFDNKVDPSHKGGVCFCAGQVGIVCAALNYKEAAKRHTTRTVRRKAK